MGQSAPPVVQPSAMQDPRRETMRRDSLLVPTDDEAAI
jgi:hypothetical protein